MEESGIVAGKDDGPTGGPTMRRLACLNCRRQKVKCIMDRSPCARCIALSLECTLPLSDRRRRHLSPTRKSHIRVLEDRIRTLESELAGSQQQKFLEPAEPSFLATFQSSPTSDGLCASPGTRPDVATRHGDRGIIARLCSIRHQVNSDEEGQRHFFGPTSGLHLSFSTGSSMLEWPTPPKTVQRTADDVSGQIQNELLDLYWRYGNPVLPLVHKEAFLADMQDGRTQYFSKLLLYCIFACAARMSDRCDIRKLSGEGDWEDEQPYFIQKAGKLLQLELRQPQVTTVQALQLLSALECARGNNTKGWLYAGDACRLIYDLGLHRDFSMVAGGRSSQLDLAVRRTVCWGSFIYDRLWSLYLGRPYYMKSCNIKVPKPGVETGSSIEQRITGSLVDLVELVGDVCDALDTSDFCREEAERLHHALSQWQLGLTEELHYSSGSSQTLCILHMLHHSVIILLNRSVAGFGTSLEPGSDYSLPAAANCRLRCEQSACQIANILDDSERLHGDGSNLFGLGLHIISTAATILVIDLADRMEAGLGDYGNDQQRLWWSLRRCVRSMLDLEQTNISGRQMRKRIQLIMRLCGITEDGSPDAANVACPLSLAGGGASILHASSRPLDSGMRVIHYPLTPREQGQITIQEPLNDGNGFHSLLHHISGLSSHLDAAPTFDDFDEMYADVTGAFPMPELNI